MKYILILSALIIAGGSSAIANTPTLEQVGSSLNMKAIDSMTYLWYQKGLDSTMAPAIENAPFVAQGFNEEEVIQRIGAIDSPFELTYNQYVGGYIQRYIKWGDWMGTVLGRSRYFFPMIEEVLDAHNLPLELKYLAVVESALKPTAFSRAGASGLWQFMYTTGKMYGLQINSFVDERLDPIKATEAAATYLADLYAIYGDWYLVIAAYNCGPGNVNKAIHRANEKRDYWDIYPFLPQETRGYVPAFIATAYTMTYHEQYNIPVILPEMPLLTDTMSITNRMNLTQVSEVLKIPMEQLSFFNPQYRKNIIPADATTSYTLRLPLEYISSYIDDEDSIMAYHRAELVDRRSVVSSVAEFSNYQTKDISGKSKLYYKVKNGDSVGLISSWFNVRTADLAYWNNIRRNRIKVGQQLVVYVPKGKKEHYSKYVNASYGEKQKLAGNSITISEKNNSSNTSSSSDIKYVYHKVKSGENPWTIAQQYPGVSSEDIMTLNGISAKGLKPGQNLKIKLK